MSLDLTTSPENAPDNATPGAEAVAANERICPQCSDRFALPPANAPGGHKRFCSDACRMAWGARAKREGAVIVTIAKIWRQNRGGGELGKLAFARLCESLDLLNAGDTEAGRKRLSADGPLAPYIKAVLAEPLIDRVRR